MAQSNRLGLPLLDAAQAQKHVTHNEALVDLDVLVHLAVSTRGVTTPPAAPTEGLRVQVGAGATAAFAGHDGEVAAYDDSGWAFFTPRAGWRLYVADEAALVIFDGAAWIDVADTIHALKNIAALGIGTASDATNLFAAKTNGGLFAARSPGEGGTGDLRLTLDKTASANTASILYQTNYAGRAEAGLAGDDNFHIKVSSDGATWRESLRIDGASGLVSFPSGVTGVVATSGGASGTSGVRCLTSHGAPAPTLGTDGDTCLDEDARVLYGPKRNGAWDLATQLGAAIVQPAPKVIDWTAGANAGFITVQRAAASNGGTVTNAEYGDTAGAGYQTFAANTAVQKTGKGIGIWPSTTNALLNSTAPAAQTVSLAAGTYILWGNGSGTIASAAGSAAGSGFGTLASLQGAFQTIVITTAGTVTITPSGAVNWFQLENPTADGYTATPGPTPLVVTGSSASKRPADQVALTDAASLALVANLAAGTIVVDTTSVSNVNAHLIDLNGSQGQILQLPGNAAMNTIAYYDGAHYDFGGIAAGLSVFTSRTRAGIAWSGSTLTLGAGSGVPKGETFAYNNGAAITSVSLGGQGSGANTIAGWLGKLELYPVRLTDTQLAATLNLMPPRASSFYNFTSGAVSLPLWTAARQRAAAGGANAKVLFWGHSLFAGIGDGPGNASLQGFSVPALLATALSASVSKAGTASLVGDNVGTLPTAYDPRLALAGAWDLYGHTLGGNMLRGQAGSKLSFTPGAMVDTAWIITSSAPGYGTITVDVDGGSPLASIETGGTAALTKQVVTFARGASHTLNLTVSGGEQHIAGVWLFDSTNREIAIFNGGKSGYRAANALASDGPGDGAPAVLGVLQPDLTIISFDANDWNNVTGDLATAVATWKTTMGQVIAAARASGDVILLSACPSNTAVAGVGSTATQQAFVTATQQLAVANGLPMIDIWTRWYGAAGGWATNNTLGWMSDNYHPNARGYPDIANEVFSMIRAN